MVHARVFGGTMELHSPRKWKQWEELGLLVDFEQVPLPGTLLLRHPWQALSARAAWCDTGVATRLGVRRGWATWVKAAGQRVPGCCLRCTVNCIYSNISFQISQVEKWERSATQNLLGRSPEKMQPWGEAEITGTVQGALEIKYNKGVSVLKQFCRRFMDEIPWTEIFLWYKSKVNHTLKPHKPLAQ